MNPNPRQATGAPASRGQGRTIDLIEKIALIDGHWQPRVVAEMNDYQFKVVKLAGDFIWHAHADTDETFIVWMANCGSNCVANPALPPSSCEPGRWPSSPRASHTGPAR
ncbi:hypothetical protein BOBR111200_19885 [Bordetella bronchialis]